LSGSSDVFQNHKLYYYNIGRTYLTTGNIETIFKSCGKGFYWDGILYGAEWTGAAVDIYTGNIRIFADKYDTERIWMYRLNVSGEVKVLNKLQKLTWFSLAYANNVTGSKEDLYNNGANCENFYNIHW